MRAVSKPEEIFPLNEELLRVTPFFQTLLKHNLKLLKNEITTLQINVGLLCNQTCLHCHLEAGPDRTEIMTTETMEQVIALAGSNAFTTIDITGGAPELHPHIGDFIVKLASLNARLIFRSNLTALAQTGESLMALLKNNAVTITASFPSLNEVQAESVRGKGSFGVCVETLKMLNSLGFGQQASGLELNLVANPAGAFLPPLQISQEKRFHALLEQKWGIVFNHLFSFANVPLGRFRQWLVQSKNLEPYIEKLVAAFNPCTVTGLMCRNILSVSWDGYLYDCDFNQAAGTPMENCNAHISEIAALPCPGSPIAVGYHCYTCTAGSGFT